MCEFIVAMLYFKKMECKIFLCIKRFTTSRYFTASYISTCFTSSYLIVCIKRFFANPGNGNISPYSGMLLLVLKKYKSNCYFRINFQLHTSRHLCYAMAGNCWCKLPFPYKSKHVGSASAVFSSNNSSTASSTHCRMVILPPACSTKTLSSIKTIEKNYWVIFVVNAHTILHSNSIACFR